MSNQTSSNNEGKEDGRNTEGPRPAVNPGCEQSTQLKQRRERQQTEHPGQRRTQAASSQPSSTSEGKEDGRNTKGPRPEVNLGCGQSTQLKQRRGRRRPEHQGSQASCPGGQSVTRRVHLPDHTPNKYSPHLGTNSYRKGLTLLGEPE